MTELNVSEPTAQKPGTSACPAVAHLPIESITPDPLNPRKHSREQIRAIAHSIATFGFNAPILVDKAGTIKVGHGRFEAAKFLKMKHVPVIRLEHLSEQQAKAYMLADNKLTDRSSWDDGLLALCLRELQDIVTDFEIEATGFEAPEIDFRIQSLDPPDAASADDEFDAPEGPAVSRSGDLWHLGPHRLFCGNALEAASYDALLNAELAAAVFTDPPYNVRINGHAVGKGRKTHREFAMASGEMSRAEFEAFLHSVLQVTQPHTQPAAVHFMCMDLRLDGAAALRHSRAGEAAGFSKRDLIAHWRAKLGADEPLVEDNEHFILTLPVRARFRGGRAGVLSATGAALDTRLPDAPLIKALAKAHRWRAMLEAGEVGSVEALAVRLKQERKHVSGILNLAFLAPDLTKAILKGEQPPGLRLAHLLAADLPLSWAEQRALLR